jgi:ankyrin repeat protein
MRSPGARTVVPIALLLVVACIGIPGSGQCGEGGPGSAELQAKDVVSALETVDTAPLLALIARHPRLPEAILTTDGVRSLGYAAAIGNASAVRILIGAGAPLDARDKLARTALYLAVANEREAAALQLIAAGANVKLSDQMGASPLHLAASLGLPIVASDLLSHGAEVDAQTVRATTPLATAAYFGHMSVVRYLLGKGANRDARDSLGKTPADWARRAGDREIESLLAGAASKP